MDYNYIVNNKKLFEKLIDKFDNFFIILDSWYLDNKYYSYIKELWINYISIENLIKKNDQERERLLTSYEIDYNNWPEDIKEEFKRIIKISTNTKVFAPQKVKEIEEARNEFKKVLKNMYKFKKKLR